MKKLARILVFVLVLCLVLTGISTLILPVRVDEYTKTYSGTSVMGDLEDAQQYPDVLFLGSSHVYTQCSPAVMYESQGIAAYLLTSASQPFSGALDLMRDQLSRHQPKVIVVDLFTAYGAEKEAMDENRVLGLAQGIASPMRRAAYLIRELGLSKGLQHWIALYNNHNRIWQLQYNAWNHHSSFSKGAEPLFRAEPQPEPPEKEYPPIPLEEEFQNLVCQMMELCREKDVELVFTMLPMPELGDMKNFAAAAQDYIEAQGGTFMYCDQPAVYREMGLNFAEDYADYHHMNVSGQTKVSCWVAQYLKEQFDLPDRRTKSGYESWNQAVDWWYGRMLEQELQQADTAFQVLDCLAQADRKNLVLLAVIGEHAAAPDQVNSGVRDCLLTLGMKPETLYEGGIFCLDQDQVLFESAGDACEWSAYVADVPLLAEFSGYGMVQIDADRMENVSDMGLIVYDKLNHRSLFAQSIYLK